ncbi:MAG: guanylate kinase [bacterium]
MDIAKVKKNNILFVISGPSGVGKTLICKNLIEVVNGISFSVSTTTRPSRNGEIEGVDYYFVSEEEFIKMIEENLFIEYAVVHGHRYGTTRSEIEKIYSNDKDALLDIDTQGAQNIKVSFPSAVLIFIMPPDLETLKERMIKREGRIDVGIEERLSKARDEIEKSYMYDYIVVNSFLFDAVEVVKAIIDAERHSVKHLILNK